MKLLSIWRRVEVLSYLKKGKAVYDVTRNEQENVTMLFTVNTCGEFA